MSETRSPADLCCHPKNSEIYGSDVDQAFVDRIKAKGILVPLLVTTDNVIISGHRRHHAATILEMEMVPVEVFASTDELDILEALVETNNARQKTNDQIGREAVILMEIEEVRAAQRMSEAGKKSAPGRPAEKGKEPVPYLSGGQSRDKVGKKLGVSGKQAGMAATVVQHIDTLIEKGETEKADTLKATLKSSVKAAYAEVKKQTAPKGSPTTETNGAPDPGKNGKLSRKGLIAALHEAFPTSWFTAPQALAKLAPLGADMKRIMHAISDLRCGGIRGYFLKQKDLGNVQQYRVQPMPESAVSVSPIKVLAEVKRLSEVVHPLFREMKALCHHDGKPTPPARLSVNDIWQNTIRIKRAWEELEALLGL